MCPVSCGVSLWDGGGVWLVKGIRRVSRGDVNGILERVSGSILVVVIEVWSFQEKMYVT